MLLDNFKLENRIAIITGAGRGVGKGIALAFAEVGATVICLARTQSEIDATAAEIADSGGSAKAISCDVTSEDQLQSMVNTIVSEFGGIDIVVNNAGGGGHGPTESLTRDFIVQTMELNFIAALNLVRMTVPHLRERNGSVLNISSGMSSVAENNCIPYAASKAALEQATRNLAHELAPDIRVNCLRLGAIETPDFENLRKAHPGVEAGLTAWTPMKRIGKPRDVALSALFLCSDAGSFNTGIVLDIDGGILLQRGVLAIMSGPK
jgi:7-alpha-hydroxysteroid dehydrogenase